MSVSVCVCVCVCLSAIISPELHVRSSPIFVRVTYGRGSVLLWRRIVIFYALPVLWMTSYLYISELAVRRRRQAEAVGLTYAWDWRVGIPVAGSGRSRLLLEVGVLCIYDIMLAPNVHAYTATRK